MKITEIDLRDKDNIYSFVSFIIHNRKDLESEGFELEDLFGYLLSDCCGVIVSQNVSVSVVSGYSQNITGYLSFSRDQGIIYVDQIFVAKEWRRNGIGSALLSFLNKKYNLKIVVLCEPALLPFYEKNGFHIVELVPSYYEPCKDAYFMRLL